MTPEAKLEALFAAQRPPARDWAFEARVAERVARRRAWLSVAAAAPWATAAAAALWGLGPVIQAVPGETVETFGVAGAMAVGLVGLLLIGRRAAQRLAPV